MRIRAGLPFTAALLLVQFCLQGCSGAAGGVEISYSRPPQCVIPVNVKRVVVARFRGSERWAGVVSEKITTALNTAIAGRDDYDVKLSSVTTSDDSEVRDTASAIALGRRSGADAVVYGDVYISGCEMVAAEPKGCMVEVSFTMDKVDSGRTITSLVIRRESGPPAEGRRAVAGCEVASEEQIVDRLLNECVVAFVSLIGDYHVGITVALEGGRSTITSNGNELAKAGRFEEALNFYHDAILQYPDDHGAMFNAGVMYEARRCFAKAREMYSRAVRLCNKAKYVRALRRIRCETEQ